ncbi:MAG: hypothetical protein ACI81R_001211 [Bradymonadia bacterium]
MNRLGGVAAMFALLAGCAHVRSAVRDSAEVVALAQLEARESANDAAILLAFHATTRTLQDAWAASNPTSSSFARSVLLARSSESRHAEAIPYLAGYLPQLDDSEGVAAAIPVLSAAGRHDDATALAWAAAQAFESDRQTFLAQYYRALASDASRMDMTELELTRESGHSLDPFRGSSSVIFRAFDAEHEIMGAWKPHQSARHQSYRGEIATYRLCAMLQCDVLMPRTRLAWMTEQQFYALTGLDEGDDTSFYARHSDVIWIEHEGQRLLPGLIKDWVPRFSRFPIEYRNTWEEWLEQDEEDLASMRDQPLRRGLRDFRDRSRGFYSQLCGLAGTTTTYDLAHQISDLHLIDALINNFDRYQGDWPGMNTHFTEGQLLSIDNGASFSLPEEFSNRTTQRRLERIERFSRQTIDALRWMPRDAARDIMLPDSPWHDDESERFDEFWQRRSNVLAHVDELIEEYGEDAVLVFP